MSGHPAGDQDPFAASQLPHNGRRVQVQVHLPSLVLRTRFSSCQANGSLLTATSEHNRVPLYTQHRRHALCVLFPVTVFWCCHAPWSCCSATKMHPAWCRLGATTAASTPAPARTPAWLGATTAASTQAPASTPACTVCRWRHGISKTKNIALPDGTSVYRGQEYRRLSLTIRRVLDGRRKATEDSEGWLRHLKPVNYDELERQPQQPACKSWQSCSQWVAHKG
jgi:hypothetical protein